MRVVVAHNIHLFGRQVSVWIDGQLQADGILPSVLSDHAVVLDSPDSVLRLADVKRGLLEDA